MEEPTLGKFSKYTNHRRLIILPQTKLPPRYLWTGCKHLQWKHLGKPDLWHIHNHSLGKNPSLTEAVALLAQSGERILLHPHDFAEDGRPGNYLSLSEVYQRAYPTGPNIHYAALNQRDRSFLAHMLEDSPSPVHLLANAVPTVGFSGSESNHRSGLPENLLFTQSGRFDGKSRELALLASSHLDFHFAIVWGLPILNSFRYSKNGKICSN